jgi:hypothetical protein
VRGVLAGDRRRRGLNGRGRLWLPARFCILGRERGLPIDTTLLALVQIITLDHAHRVAC